MPQDENSDRARAARMFKAREHQKADASKGHCRLLRSAAENPESDPRAKATATRTRGAKGCAILLAIQPNNLEHIRYWPKADVRLRTAKCPLSVIKRPCLFGYHVIGINAAAKWVSP